jgi:spermidine synthase
MATYVELPAPSKAIARRSTWPLVLYTLTGFSGVLAEQGFEKYLALLVGATVSSSAIVIFAYFLGFALGGWAVAALARRRNLLHPLRAYAVLELLVGISCVAFSYGFHPLTAYLAGFQSAAASPLQLLALRFVFGAILILPSAALMGASFPLIAQAVDRDNSLSGQQWIRVYGCNLGGAVVAALAGAYVVLPWIGVRGAMWLCLAIGAAVFAVCFLLRESAAGARQDAIVALEREPVRDGGLLLSAAFFSGLIFLALEVLWTHLIATVLGASIYAFASMLAAVLIGLFLGSLRARKIDAAAGSLPFSRLIRLAALLLIVQVRLWDFSQAIFLIDLPVWIKSFYTVEAFKFLVGALLIVPPAALLGSIYPMLLRNPSLAAPGAGYFVGYLNMANSFGCLAGALLGVFFFIPVLGSEWSLKMIAMLLLAIGMLFLWKEQPSRQVLVKTAAWGVVLSAFICWCNWNPMLLTSGLNVYFGQDRNLHSEPDRNKDKPGKVEIVFFEEHAQGGFTTVVEHAHAGERTKHVLFSNGKFEGSDDLKDQGFAQISFAALPSQFTSGFERALVIGLGTGHSAHSLAQIGFRKVEIAEFAPGIVHAAGKLFRPINGAVLEQPNVDLHLEDGRNYLLMAPPNSLDVVSIEVTSVWFAGATNLYSREFYQLVQSRLRPGGAFEQWIQFHHTSPREIAVEIATLRSVFPYVSVWNAGGQGMLIATNHPQVLTDERRVYLEGRLALLSGIPQSAQADLRAQVLDSQLLTTAGVDRLVKAGYQTINTDHNRWLEYTTPRYNWSDQDWPATNFAWIKTFSNAAQTAAGGPDSR